MTSHIRSYPTVEIGEECLIHGRLATVVECDLRNDGVHGIRVAYADTGLLEWVELPPVQWWWPHKTKGKRDQMTLHIAVPIRPGDVELYGEDPYRSAQNWHAAWQRTLPVIEAARGYVEARARLSRPEGEYNETDDRWMALLAALAEFDSKGG